MPVKPFFLCHPPPPKKKLLDLHLWKCTKQKKKKTNVNFH